MPTSAPQLHENYRRLIHFCALTAWCVHAAFIIIFAANGITFLAWFNVWSVAMHSYAWWRSRPGGNLQQASDLIGAEVALHAVAATITLGWDSGFHYLMIPMVPICMLSTQRPRHQRLGIALAATVLYIALKVWSTHMAPLYQVPAEMLLTLEYSCLCTLFLAFMAMATRYHDIVADAQEKLAREASTDPLTGALNRRRLTQLAHRLPPHGCSALLLCDIDFFKRVNDQYGHEAGDLVLQHFHQHMQTCTRAGDHLCRWGGEEFLLLLPQTDAPEARQVAQRLLETTAKHPVAIPGTGHIPITVTIGLTYLWPGETLQTALMRADAALYRGKANGRNQVQEEAVVLPNSSAESAPASGNPVTTDNTTVHATA